MNRIAKLLLPTVIVAILSLLSCDNNTEHTTVIDTVNVLDTVHIYIACPDPTEEKIYCTGGFYDPKDTFPVPGGGACFEIIDVYAVVDSITPYNHIAYNVFFSVFRKSDYKRITEMDDPYNQKYQRYKINANCVLSKRFSVGDTLSGQLEMLVNGTITPTPILTIFDSQQCFSVF